MCPLFCLLARDLSAFVRLVSYQHHSHVFHCLLTQLPHPVARIVKCLAIAEVKHHKGSLRLAEVAASSRTYLVMTERYCSCPAVSQICALTVWLASTDIVFEEYSMPRVGPLVDAATLAETKLEIILVLPTAESPRKTTACGAIYFYRRRGTPPAYDLITQLSKNIKLLLYSQPLRLKSRSISW